MMSLHSQQHAQTGWLGLLQLFARFRTGMVMILLVAALPVKAYAAPQSEILDNFNIPTYNGTWNEVDEMSGLAWDEDEQLLYAESDQGQLVKFKVELGKDKIISVTPVFFGPLKLKSGDSTFTDAEDIVILNSANGKKGDTQIGVVFEDGPAAGLFDDQGQFISPIKLPAPLSDPTSYAEPNRTIESIATNTDHGFLFVPQVPIIGQKKDMHTVYAEDGSTWSYETLQPKRTSTKSMQTQPDGSLMILEGVNLGGFWSKLDMGTHEMHLRRMDPAACKSGEMCPIIDYVPKDPEAMTDRFEGLTRISDNLYLIITDQTWGARLSLVRITQ
jgi:hypothetical protein